MAANNSWTSGGNFLFHASRKEKRQRIMWRKWGRPFVTQIYTSFYNSEVWFPCCPGIYLYTFRMKLWQQSLTYLHVWKQALSQTDYDLGDIVILKCHSFWSSLLCKIEKRIEKKKNSNLYFGMIKFLISEHFL